MLPFDSWVLWDTVIIWNQGFVQGLRQLMLPFCLWSLTLWSLMNFNFFPKQSFRHRQKQFPQPVWVLGVHPAAQASLKVTERTEPGALTFFNLQGFYKKLWTLLPPLLFWKKGRREEREAPAFSPEECFLTVSFKSHLLRRAISKPTSDLGMN